MKQALIFGEALFDVFPDNKKILGGAPFNVAWNLTQFGAHPLFVTRIGNDASGETILQRMRANHMETTGVQIDDSHPTGTVTIEINANSHQFNINADQAYDYIDSKQISALLVQTKVDLLYFGSLAIRAPASAEALNSLLQSQIPAFVDINLRAPWWNITTIHKALAAATWAKLNDEELILISQEIFGEKIALEKSIEKIFEKFDLQLLVVTCGAKGAYLRTPSETLFQETPQVDVIKDTVGAGDAFSSVTLLGIIQNWDYPTLLARALAFASRVCELQGAISEDPQFYQQIQKEWHNS